MVLFARRGASGLAGRAPRIKQACFTVLRFCLLLGLSFTILFPLFTQVSSSFMTREDLLDPTVKYFSRQPTLDNYRYIIENVQYFRVLLNTLLICAICAVLQTLFAAFVGYGFAKARSTAAKLLFLAVVVSILIPPQMLRIPLYMTLRYPDIWGIFRAATGSPLSFSLVDSPLTMAVISISGMGYRCGLFVFMMRQFYRGIPKELSEAAYVDGAGVYGTYFRIIFPQGKSLMVTIAIIVFAWQWTDRFYSSLMFPNFKQISTIISEVNNVSDLNALKGTLASGLLSNAATVLIVIPLALIYVFAQKHIVKGFASSGIVG